MTRDKMLELLTLLNPDSAKALTLAGLTDEQLELAIFHEALHIDMQRSLDVKTALTDNHKTMRDYWGERCPEFEPECACCAAWAEFDKTGNVTRDV